MISSLTRRLREASSAIVVGACWVLLTCFFLPACWIFSLLPARIRYDNPVYFFLTYWWSRTLLLAAGLRIRMHWQKSEGKVPSIVMDQPVLFVFNHASALDILLAEVVVGASFSRMWLVKAEYLRVPLFGRLVSRMHVPVKRGSARHAASALIKARELLVNKNRHALLFPEGQRSESGQLQQFLTGFAYLARVTGRPVVPVALCGAATAMKKKAWLPTFGSSVEVVVGPPFVMKHGESDEAFVARVRDWFVQNLKNI